MSVSPGYSIVVRIKATPELHASGAIITAVAATGAVITGLDVTDPGHESVSLDLSCMARDTDHVEEVKAALSSLEGCEVEKVSDSVFLIHLGGKIEIALKTPIRNRTDLARAYTPGVARVCMAIYENPEDARNLTIKRNSVAVVTDGSAVLGLGDIGPQAAMPVMEGKAALFKKFADVDAWPICLDTKDVDEIVRTVQLIAPGFGGINLEDIAAPRCFEIERRLRELLDIPVFHDDQHGTAVVVLAALINALRLVKKNAEDLRVVMIGAGAAGVAVSRLLMKSGVQDIILFDSKGAIFKGRSNLDEERTALAEITNPRGHTGTIAEALVDADVFIGLSQPNLITGDDISRMAPDSIVFALANPEPEIDPVEAAKYARVVATGRSDYPNQINNVLAFPGIFRGILDGGSHKITDEALIAAARAIASVVTDEALSAIYIVPSVFDPSVAPAVAEAVSQTK
ncbi:MAG: NAD-dependent malic enzyme [Candidatus Nanopelagicales bacterium]|jgi:malate dehydrogenase (oxaloacetate-decarboxylating)|nr:NAD-dependent malic enzyme [Candidatus Nanopelagicales bacterium]